ncbi:MAG: type III-B CRISPR module-associated protein Cmr3 [Cyclonatronaceae bacterium]
MSDWFIRASDVLFFKDGREVAPGSEYSAASVFPPNPQTLYGALRSALLSNDPATDFGKADFGQIDEEIKRLAGSKTATGELHISHFTLATQKDGKTASLYRLPVDVLKRKKPPQGKASVVTTRQKRLSDCGIRSNMPAEPLLSNWFVHEEGAFFEYVPIFITESVFEEYLLDGPGDGRISGTLSHTLINSESTGKGKPESFFTQEPRMGIVIDKQTRTVEEGKLFTTPFVRLNDMNGIGFKLSVNIDNALLGDDTSGLMLRLGGDGKLAALSPVTTNHNSDTKQPSIFMQRLQKKLKGRHHFKAVLSSPAVFEQGWIPDGLDPDTLKGEINGVKLTLKAASLSRYINIGGWNVALNRPKYTRRAVAPGAVYYFETEEALSEKDITALHAGSICSHDNGDYKKQGLGIIHLGVA